MNLLPLAWTYFRSRALLAMSALAIALGVAVLFTVLAVFNGFLSQVESTLRAFSGDVVVNPLPAGAAPGRGLADYHSALASLPLAEAAPRLNWFGLIGRRGADAIADPRTADLSGLLLVGVDRIPAGLRASLAATLPAAELPAGGMIVGAALAEQAGVAAGDEIAVISYRHGSAGYPVPVRGTFRVAAVFSTGRFDLDLDRALVRRDDLARMIGSELGFTEIGLWAAPGMTPDQLARAADQALRDAGLDHPAMLRQVETWRAQGGNFLRAIENQRKVLGIVFFAIVLVAAYQLVATLVLTVAEKRRDIGVLGALGAAPARILGFFVGLGVFIAALGSALGLALGAWLSSHLELVDAWLGGMFNRETYVFDTIPTAVDWPSVGLIVGGTLAAALVFSLLPAWWATGMPIVRALRR